MVEIKFIDEKDKVHIVDVSFLSIIKAYFLGWLGIVMIGAGIWIVICVLLGILEIMRELI